MRRFIIDGLLVVIIIALFMTFTSVGDSTTNNADISAYDSTIRNSQTIKDGIIEDPAVVEVDNGNIVTRISYAITNGIQKLVQSGFSALKGLLKSFLD